LVIPGTSEVQGAVDLAHFCFGGAISELVRVG
jgi:hypothetical protein